MGPVLVRCIFLSTTVPIVRICSRAGGAVSGRLNARFPALPVETVRQADRQTVSCLVGHSDYCEAYKQQLSGYLLYLPIVHQVCTVRNFASTVRVGCILVDAINGCRSKRAALRVNRDEDESSGDTVGGNDYSSFLSFMRFSLIVPDCPCLL